MIQNTLACGVTPGLCRFGLTERRHNRYSAALPEHREALLWMVEVAELDAAKLALANTAFEQQMQGEPVRSFVAGEDGAFLVLAEDGSFDAAFLGRLDRPHRVAVKLPVQRRPLEEHFQDRDVLRLCPN